MQPNETPAIGRYMVRCVIAAGGAGTFTEILNTTGHTITPTRPGNSIVLTAEPTGAFINGKTLVLESPKKTAGVQLLVTSITPQVVTLNYAQVNADEIIIQVETVNI